jgi:hypothetical protein
MLNLKCWFTKQSYLKDTLLHLAIQAVLAVGRAAVVAVVAAAGEAAAVMAAAVAAIKASQAPYRS